MAKKTAKKTSARKRAPKKAARRRSSSTTKSSKSERLTPAQKKKALGKLKKIGQRPSHPTKHLGPVLPLDMGPPEMPKRRGTARKKSTAKKRPKKKR